ncbi:glycosyltransferase family 39 protein [Lewinella sp. 4G2]|uniref:ArnT family glycosyltransferase n=1 Tax=Lewinella sp. 4G2 TaxID=1803372 RepID=UPI0007B49540|nr:glycosyltransferase family 39 protein [Lewinella sp. 4G2]OAV44267.1 hypothetical protein A3850_007055 [Lewinella sp. 4G2]
MPDNPKRLFFLLPALLAILLVGSEIVERSMYTDGVAYAGISKNLANGIGTFWNPKLSEVHNYDFHSHPPLMFGLQSLVFRVFGDGLVSERIYTLLVFLLSAWLMIVLWREALRDRPGLAKIWFLPLTIWLANEVVYHFYAANILEPTMTAFTLGAVYLGLLSLRENTPPRLTYTLAFAAGLLVFLATLTKGVVGLFPLAFYGIHWLIYRRQSLAQALFCTLLMVFAVVGLYVVLFQFAAPAEALRDYFSTQVLSSLNSEYAHMAHHRADRTYIIRKGLAIILPAVVISALLFYAGRRKGATWRVDSPSTKAAFLFLTLALAAFLPLAISPKQSFYYLLPSMAYFALGFSLFIAPAAAHLYELKLSRKWQLALVIGTALLAVAATINTTRHWGAVNSRDRVVLNDIDEMNAVVPAGATIGAVGDARDMVSYFARISNVSLDTTQSTAKDYAYFIVPMDSVNTTGTRVPLRTEKYELWRRQ